MRTLGILVAVVSVVVALKPAAGEGRFVAAVTAAPSGAGRATDVAGEFSFTGNTVFTAEALGEAVASYRGKPLDQRQLDEMARRVVHFYHDRGYLARVTASQIGGTVNLRVTESRIGKVEVTGTQRFSKGFIRDHFSGLKQQEVWTKGDLERPLLILRALPGMQSARAVLEAGAEPGTTDIQIDISEQREPLRATVEFDTFGSPFSSQERFSERLCYDNLSGRGDALALQVLHGFDPDAVMFGDLSYSIPINAKGTRVGVHGSAGDFELGRQLGVLGLRGEGRSLGLSTTHPFIKSKKQSLTATAALDVDNTDFDMDVSCPTGGQSPMMSVSEDRIRKIRLGVVFDGVEKAGEARNIASLYLHQGLGGFLGGTTDPSAGSVSGADNSFTKLTLEAARLQKLSDRTFVTARFAGQYSPDSLLAGEVISVGGADSVRGFYQSAHVGDSGIQVSVELRHTLLEAENRKAWLQNLQGVFFVDHGSVFESGGAEASRHLTGTGVGVRASLAEGFSLRADVGYALSEDDGSDTTPDRAAQGGGAAANDGPWEFYFLIQKTLTF